MPFIPVRHIINYGINRFDGIVNRYCVDNVPTTDPNWGKCYTSPGANPAIYIYTGSETPACQTEGTCTRYSTTTGVRTIATLFDQPAKQAILSFFSVRSHTVMFGSVDTRPAGMLLPNFDTDPYLWVFPQYIFRSVTYPYYDPVVNMFFDTNPYTITRGTVYVMRWSGSFLTNKIILIHTEAMCNNCWSMSSGMIVWQQEASPLAIIKLRYEEWLAHKELRSSFGYSITGIHQSGWSAQDMIRALKEVYPDRSWAVYDDREYTLYIYNLDIDDVPEGLFDLLTVASVVVLKPKTDADAALRWIRDISSYFEQNYGGQEEGQV